MEKQTLTIEQMQELQELGIDTSNASMFWYRCYRFKQLIPCSDRDTIKDWTNQHGENCIIPTFTLNDIVDILPQYIEEKEIGRFDYELRIKKDEATYESFDVHNQLGEPFTLINHSIYDDECETILDCAFEMLKWCKQNKYI